MRGTDFSVTRANVRKIKGGLREVNEKRGGRKNGPRRSDAKFNLQGGSNAVERLPVLNHPEVGLNQPRETVKGQKLKQ